MNSLLKSVMKLRNVRTKLTLLFLTVLMHSFGQSTFSDVNYFRQDYSIEFFKNQSFRSNDSLLTNISGGHWKIENKKCILQNDTLVDTLTIIFSSHNKLVFGKKEKRFAYHDHDSFTGADKNSTTIFRGILGMLFLFLVAFFLSRNRKKINWSIVIRGTILQIGIAFIILKVPYVSNGFEWISKAFTKLINFSHDGATFLFKPMGLDKMPDGLMTFMTWILPSIIFFAAISSLLYYFGILQFIIKKIAWVMYKALGISGSESIATAANIFIGQTEAPLLVKPYLSKMTKSELLCLMVGGMATIAGGVLAAVIGILGGGDEVQELYYAKHLLTASFMSAPAAIVFSKILVPETETPNKTLDVPKEQMGENAIEAIANGTTEGLKLAANVGAMLIVFTSLVALSNYILGKVGDFTSLNELIASGGMYQSLSFESIAGYVLSPVAWIMGVEWQDSMYFGQLLGEKTIINEFIAYPHLGDIKDELSHRTILMSTYVLCGFANISSIGIQVGGIGILIPERRGTLAKYGLIALLGGSLACMSTSILAGILF